jgi:hypothetical protein
VSTSGSGRDDRPLPLWPAQADPLPLPPASPAPAPYQENDGWPDPPAPVWPAYQPAPRKRRTLPVVLGVATALVLLAAGSVAALVLTQHPARKPATAAAPAPTVTSLAPSPSTAPGAGASFAAGDCLEVTSTGSGALDNAKRVRQDCAGAYFATVLARVAGKPDCPADTTVSRIDDAGQVLCLGQGAHGAIARPGDCVRVPTTFALPLIRTDCATSDRPFRLEAIVDDAARCPDGSRGAPYSGYDRVLCVRFP